MNTGAAAWDSVRSMPPRTPWRVFGVGVLALCLAAPGSGRTESSEPSLAEVQASTRRDMEQSGAELNELRDRIAEQRRPLAEQMRQLEMEVAQRRDQVRGLAQARERERRALQDLREEVNNLEDACDYVHATLTEYRRATEARASLPCIQQDAGRLAAVDARLADPEDCAALSPALDLLLERAEEWNQARLGGRRFAGIAVDRDGREQDGVFAQWGPVAYFIDEDRTIAGAVVPRPGRQLPVIEPLLTPSEQRNLESALEGRSGTLPLDPSLGDALRVREARRSWIEHMLQGGVVMVPILGVGLVALWLMALKAVQMHRLRPGDPERLRAIVACLNRGDEEGARVGAEGMGAPFGPVLLEGIRYRTAARTHLEEILHERILSLVPGLERHLGTLAALGGIAPLLGLLGTVTGIMRTFQLVTVFGTGDAQLLSGGISEALVTTQFGLVIAIPALLAHALFARRVRTLVGAMEHGALAFVNGISHTENEA